MTKFRFDLHALKRLARFVASRSSEDRIPQVAGSLTFTTVLSLVPLVTVAFALFTAFPIFSSFQSSLQVFLSHRLMPAQINNEIFRYLNDFAAKARSLTTMGMVALILTSVMTMMTVESALNVIWRVRKARPLAQRILVYWAVITLGPILFGASLSISSYVLTRSMAFSGAHQLPGILAWALTGATLPLTAVAFTMLYVYLPNCRVAWRDAAAGGVLAALAFELAKRAFGLYIKHFPTYKAVYGAFAAIPIFLLWVYLSWLITLLGAMIASILPAIRIGQFHRLSFAGSDLLDALDLLGRLVGAREEGKSGHTAEELARMLRCDIETVRRLANCLESREWIAQLYQEGLAERYVLLANPAQVTVRDLFDLFVIDRAELSYQLGLSSSCIDGPALLAALDNDKLNLSLLALLEARAAQQARAAQGPQAAAAGTPHETAGAHPGRI